MQKGFTLIELAIVLVIIGLLVGGVLAGNELIEQSKIRSTIKELESYQTAVDVFHEKYRCLPGDCDRQMAISSEIAHNGDGDGFIEWYWEVVESWEVLSETNIITGEYTGTGCGGTELGPGINIPESSICENCGYQIRHWNDGRLLYNNRTGNFLTLAEYDCTANNPILANPLTSLTAYTIDAKIDDGRPAAGKIFGIGSAEWWDGTWQTPKCTNSTGGSSDMDVDYDLATTDTALCSLFYELRWQ